MPRRTIAGLAALTTLVAVLLMAAASGVIVPGPRPYDASNLALMYIGVPTLLVLTLLFVFWIVATARESRKHLERLENASSDGLSR